MITLYRQNMSGFNFNRALQEVWKVIGHLNRYIVTNEPWELAKDPAQKKRLLTVLYVLAEALRIVALVLLPVMPQAAAKMIASLGLDAETDAATLETSGKWGVLKPGTAIEKGPQLFPRLDKKKKTDQQPKQQSQKKNKEKKKEQPREDGLVGFDQFGKLELRVAEIVSAEKIKKSDRLLKLTVKAPEERTIVAGIAQYYDPDELIGMLVIIVANLKPAKLMGVLSQGMVLAAKEKGADGNEQLVLSTVSGTVAPGSRVA
jgi:methionyl-tRNA synthetase